jgi:flagellar protein FlbD
MIRVHRMNGEELMLNEHHIEIMEEKPNTVVTLTNDRKYILKETIEEILGLIRDFNRSMQAGNNTSG